MTYRYIFLVLRLTENLFLGRASRTVGMTSPGEQRRWVGASMGTLMSRSLKLSNDVYAAMVARGFSGDVRTLTTFRMRDEDWLFVSLGVALLGLAWLVEGARRSGLRSRPSWRWIPSSSCSTSRPPTPIPARGRHWYT